MNSQFHSNIMRQLIATARHQARPPVALMGWLAELDEPESNGSSRTVHPGAAAVHLQRRTSPGGSAPIGQSRTLAPTARRGMHPATPASVCNRGARSKTPSPSPPRGGGREHQISSDSSWPLTPARQSPYASASRLMSAIPTEEPSFAFGPSPIDNVWDEGEDQAVPEESITTEDSERSDDTSLPYLFQKMILTRRTRSRFAPPSPHSSSEQWIAALDRAVRCGYAAPNHKRTEPFTFRRLIAPSSKTEQLAELAYHVQMRKQELLRKQKQRQRNASSSSNHDDCDSTQDDHMLLLDNKSARRKQEKWSQIPAWLVATVRSPSVLEQLSNVPGSTTNASAASPVESESTSRFALNGDLSPSTATARMYDPLEYQPPGTNRELEDYASCCAAVQNVLLSLHSEGIASKWATGDVVQTPAFRSLLELPDDERVVALIQVGWPPESAAAKSARSVSSYHSSEDSRWAVNAYTPSSIGEHPALTEPPRPRRHHRALKGDVLIDL